MALRRVTRGVLVMSFPLMWPDARPAGSFDKLLGKRAACSRGHAAA